MTKLHALFDGKVLRPEEPLPLQANTRVLITIETPEGAKSTAFSFLHTANSLNIEGPSDWSEHVDDYLYHGAPRV